MTLLVKLFSNILLLRAGPQDVPAAPALLLLTSLVSILSSVMVISITLSFERAVLQTVLDYALLAGFSMLVLWSQQQQQRWLQTFTALNGVGVLLNLLSWPLFLVVSNYPVEQLSPPYPQAIRVANLLFLGLMVWSLLVSSHIFRLALNKTWSVGFLVSVGYMAAIYYVLNLLPERLQ